MQKLQKAILYTFDYKGIHVEIRQWGFRSLEHSEDDLHAWNYYLYLRPDFFADKVAGDSIWLETKIMRITPVSPERETHDYYDNPILAALDMHGGITFYSKECEHPKIVKVGCDFMHLYDDQTQWDEQMLAADAKNCIDKFLEANQYVPLYKTPPNAPTPLS